MKAIGFDFGSVYTKGILIDDANVTDLFFYQKKTPDDLSAIYEFLAKIGERYPGEKFRFGITGMTQQQGRKKDFHLVNGIVATSMGAKTLGFTGRSIFEIGGQHAKLLLIDPENFGNIREFAMNDACAAGSGMFIEQQAKRMELDIEEFSRLSSSVDKHVAIAGRCAVFAKSDMIHLQQKGFQVDELGYGLCSAICQNFLAILLKGKEVETPVLISGGCAKNGGIFRAFKEILQIENPKLIMVSSYPGLEGAIGAGIKAADDYPEFFSLATIQQKLTEVVAAIKNELGTLLPLTRTADQEIVSEPECNFADEKIGFLGVDVGSVSTDMAVMTAEGEVISSVYLPTRGRPIEVLGEGLAILKKRFAGGLKILGCGTTGSGRHLAGKILGADIVKNEITCQFLGVKHYIPEVDTIFEIGGQDSKFISIQNCSINDFVMNKVCAAGTGSFLEEQAAEMGISIKDEFANFAFRAEKPVDLGSHCTVFMETEVLSALHNGVPKEDVCAGLAYSIVRNYLEKVVGNKPVGRKVAFQGGVA